MTGTTVADHPGSLRTLRLVAAVGAGLALILVVMAFAAGWMLGTVTLALAPIVPLALVLLVDRILPG